MKKTYVLKISAVVLVLSMILTLAACSDNGTGSSVTSSNSDESTATPEETPDPFGKYDPVIEVTSYKVLDENLKFPKDFDINNNIWIDKAVEELGIRVNNVWSVPKTQVETKINMQIASNDMPDISFVNDRQFKLMVDSGMAADITDVYNDYASELSKNAFEVLDKGVGLSQSTVDGKLYAIPEVRDSLDASPVLWIRNDWLKNVGLSAPKTIDDLVAVADAFVNNDPNKSGKKDTLGLGAAATKNLNEAAGGLQGFFMGFNSYAISAGMDDVYLKDGSGNVVNAGTLPETKAALAKLADMYKNGLLDREFATRDPQKIAELATAGTLGLVYAEHWFQFFWPVPSAKTEDPEADWIPLDIPTVDGKPAKIVLPGSATNYYVVNKNAKNPEALIKLLNLNVKIVSIQSDEYDQTYQQREYTTDNGEEEKFMVWQWSAVRTGAVGGNMYGNERIAEWYKNKNDDYKETEKFWVADMIEQIQKYTGEIPGNDNMWNWATWIWQNPDSGAYTILKKYFDDGRTFSPVYLGVDTPTMTEKKATLRTMRTETFISIIMSGEVDKFEKYVDDWKKLGGDDIIDEVTEAIGE